MSDDVEIVLGDCLGHRGGKYAQLVSGLQLAHYPLRDGDATQGAEVLIALMG